MKLSNEKTVLKSVHTFDSFDATDRHRPQTYNISLFGSSDKNKRRVIKCLQSMNAKKNLLRASLIPLF